MVIQACSRLSFYSPPSPRASESSAGWDALVQLIHKEREGEAVREETD